MRDATAHSIGHMNGIDAITGKRVSGLAHLRQSIRDILTTPIGSRVMRRDYGSRLYELVDAPVNRETLLDLYGATAEALAIWEPRIEVEQVTAESAEPGRVVLALSGVYIPTGEVVTIDGIEVS
jgi:phage baseplate assembly protein W